MTKEELEIQTNKNFIEMCDLIYRAYYKGHSYLDKLPQREKEIIYDDVYTVVYHPNLNYRITFEILELSEHELCIFLNDSWCVDDEWYDEKIFGCYTDGINHIEHYRVDQVTFGWYHFGIVIDGIKKCTMEQSKSTL